MKKKKIFPCPRPTPKKSDPHWGKKHTHTYKEIKGKPSLLHKFSSKSRTSREKAKKNLPLLLNNDSRLKIFITKRNSPLRRNASQNVETPGEKNEKQNFPPTKKIIPFERNVQLKKSYKITTLPNPPPPPNISPKKSELLPKYALGIKKVGMSNILTAALNASDLFFCGRKR